jgi:hypothetical protein
VKKIYGFLIALITVGLLYVGVAGAFTVTTGTIDSPDPDAWGPWPAAAGSVVEFEARIGNAAAGGNWELGHKFDGGYLDTSGQYAWPNNTAVGFTLTHNSLSGDFTLRLADSPGVPTISTTWNSNRPCQAVKEIWVLLWSKNNSLTPKVLDMAVGGVEVPVDPMSATNNKKWLRIDGEQFENFTFAGQMILEWRGNLSNISPDDIQILISVVFADNQDSDGDTYGPSCDCGPDDATMHPGAAEICDGKDNDCIGGADDGLTFVDYYQDNDSDSHGNAAASQSTCDGALAGYVTDNTDCDDADGNNFPDNPEVCDGADNDCDTVADNGLTFITYYYDGDSDSYGDVAFSLSTCDGAPAGHVANSADCNDANPEVNPGVAEATCDGVDNDCLTDTPDEPNVDGDGATACTDCDDNDPANWPGNPETCTDGQDNNCDFIIDDPVMIGAQPYASLQDAYDDITGGTSENIKMRATADVGDLIANSEVLVTLLGGYDDSYNGPSPVGTVISGTTPLTIRNGTVYAEHIILR